MESKILLLLCICFNQFVSIKSSGSFKYQNGQSEDWNNNCECGPEKLYFSYNDDYKYCCVNQYSPIFNDCQIDVSSWHQYKKWCPNATLLSNNQLCNNNCLNNEYDICPSNPEACMHSSYGCDGRQRCEAFCAGPLENFPYYNHTAKKCLEDFLYCEKRDEAKYHNHQCFKADNTFYNNMIGYRCLNRKDMKENSIRSKVNYKNFVSARKNLFQYFKPNDTINQVTETQIICDDQAIDIDCHRGMKLQIIECKKGKEDIGAITLSNHDTCDALDFLEDKGLPAPPAEWTQHIYARPQHLSKYIICMCVPNMSILDL